MGAIGPYHYKVWVIGDILDRYESCKNGARKPKAKLFVKPSEEKKLNRNAYFENVVIYAVDIENIIESLESPLREIIAGRYFEGDVRTFMEDFGIRSRREARRLIVRAVNKFFHEVERYRRSTKNTA
ncbi:hypothetical protein [Hydrogenivirga sp. 128-5-R1-1]|uniref:hypothetical protein n=1 Tax=Hydrogenivirga sp. 128-5-R1-1 TaxID=392423 RepID=UPI00015F18E9|nr:hypothetical protein [Hydrogenivirga sp. 128-5-R1-1]EDP75332.1 hypothetical protein HG1285_15246 [Hydrogenivirga sp. 128-5-R1-1]